MRCPHCHAAASTAQADYGRQCRATSERFRVDNGKIVEIFEGGLSSDWPSVSRKARQESASLHMHNNVKRSKDTDGEAMDERCFFPVTNIDMTLPRDYQEVMPLVKRVYSVVDKASYLDWGLTSDYIIEDAAGEGDEAEGGGRPAKGLRKRLDNAPSAREGPALVSSSQYSTLPSFAQHASRKLDKIDKQGGTAGSEGYGEATTGSVHKIGLLLTHLRQLVLEDLHDTHWGLMWDLGPHSTFLDIGSGYGKVVLHLRLLARMRRAVGLECVASRDQIAKQALFALEAEIGAEGENAGAVRRPKPKGANGGAKPSADSQPQSSERTVAPPSIGDESSADALPRIVRSGPFDGVEFEQGDACAFPELSYTHIYIFDWVFSQSTLHDLAPVLQRSPFYILCSFRKPSEWWGHGLVKIQPVAKLPGFRTTGGEGMTCYVYLNMEKVPAT